MIKAVLFDFDGVLTTDATGSESICRYICGKTGLDVDEFKREYYKYNSSLLYGKVRHADIWGPLCRNLNVKIEFGILFESFINTPIDGRMLAIIDGLKSHNYKIGMVTDNKTDRIAAVAEHFSLNGVFDIITVSAEVGSGKDNDEIFIKTIEGLNVNADECIFIDNREKNLVVPKGMGMNVIYFDHQKRDYAKLIQEFRKLSILI